ncbi:hypothetical protein BHE74_00028522 [Ensete ventricosum]|nr:hypothetical protein BHE74_00028522 [Ensete ventricosum]
MVAVTERRATDLQAEVEQLKTELAELTDGVGSYSKRQRTSTITSGTCSSEVCLNSQLFKKVEVSPSPSFDMRSSKFST